MTHQKIDFYHAMGCYAMMENGFVSKKEVSQDFVFPSLHAIRDQQVATNLTKLIRKYLPKRFTKAIKTSFSSKSQRKAGVTLLSADPNMRFPQIHARTGHSSGSHMDSYLENVGLVLSLPACLSMNGYKNLYQDVYPPTFACLGIAHQSMAKKLILQLFHVSSKDLKEDGRLYSFTIVMGATLVMYHNFMRRVYKPTDPVVCCVEEVARSIGLDVNTLAKWITRMKTDFIQGNNKNVLCDNIHQVIPSINQNTQTLQELQQGMIKQNQLLQDLTFNLQMERLNNMELVSENNELKTSSSSSAGTKKRKIGTEAIKKSPQLLALSVARQSNNCLQDSTEPDVLETE